LGRSREVSGLPPRDLKALILIGGVFVTGFVVEGIRIGMTGAPPGTGYSFIGYTVSRFLGNLSGLTQVYGYMWYCHAGVVGLFVAYLPFSRMIHMFVAPIALAVRAVDDRCSGAHHSRRALQKELCR
jgi:nitrate reductase gamma subunit